MAVWARHGALEELGLAKQLPAAPCLHQGQHQGIWWLHWVLSSPALGGEWIRKGLYFPRQ